ncbi:DUF7344 domain-containing protein [Haladaptatus sp. DFWS20]|uniref:DUF7344 domain-containing protein n=1 Tax=Haladaptatus sp. DFWS20 TaxID=3403467 RepID=UPI003EBC973F
MAEMRDEPRNDRTGVRRGEGISFSLRSAIQTLGLNALLRLPPELYEALASEHRRTVLSYLHENDGRATITELAAHLVTSGIEASEQRAHVVLQHVHLPKLAERGFVEWASRRDTVALGRELN